MKDFDHDGLLLAEYQGKIFEQSTELRCSTGVFLRRFLHSDFLKKIDKNNVSSLSLDYGNTKLSNSALFWIGYIYRYLSDTRDISTKKVMKLFPYKQLNDVYYSFHTQDPEWCVRSLLEMNGLTEDVFDKNLRLKALISGQSGQ